MGQQSSKKERRDSARQARVQAARARARAKQRKRTALVVLVAMLAGAGGFLAIQNRANDSEELKKVLSAAGCTDIKELEELGASPHLGPNDPAPTYNSTPPTSGLHGGSTAPWGLSDEKIDDKSTVHNLEHGGVIVHYKATDVDENELEQVEDYVDAIDVNPETQSGVILQPNPDINDNVAMASWGHLQTCRKLTLEAVKAYIRKECGKGPESFVCAPSAK